MKMHFVASLIVANALLALAWNVSGDSEHNRMRRSPDKYDDDYSKFLERNFKGVGDQHIDKKAEYKQIQKENNDDYSDNEKSADGDDETGSEDGDSKDASNTHGVDHDWFYEGKKDYERIKALSERQVAELQQKPGNCKHYVKDDMLCATCEDPETGDNSESCHYSSKPHDKKIAYLSKKSHNYKKPQPVEAEETEEEDNENEGEDETAVHLPSGPKPLKTLSEKEDADYGAYKLAGSNDDVETNYDDSNDEPKFAQIVEQKVNDFEIVPETDFKSKNFNEALTDFASKDWSKCNKMMKGEMTCYYCADAKGAVQEECMFVSASNPKSFKVEHSETKNYNNNNSPTTDVTPQKKSVFSKKPLGLSKSESIKAEPKDFNSDKKEKFARLRVGRPLMPTKATLKATAEPLVTPTTFLSPENLDEFKAGNKKAIKRTISQRQIYRDNDPFQTQESKRIVHFESHVRHLE